MINKISRAILTFVYNYSELPPDMMDIYQYGNNAIFHFEYFICFDLLFNFRQLYKWNNLSVCVYFSSFIYWRFSCFFVF